jgi:hypothetical protein
MRLSCIWVWFISFIIYFIPFSSDFELQVSNNYFNFILSDLLLKLKERCLDANITSWVLHHNFIHCCSFIHRYCSIYSEMYIWPFTNNDIILQLYITSVYYVLPEGYYKHYLKHVEVVSLYIWTNAVSWK